jgi:hypothetical protein
MGMGSQRFLAGVHREPVKLSHLSRNFDKDTRYRLLVKCQLLPAEPIEIVVDRAFEVDPIGPGHLGVREHHATMAVWRDWHYFIEPVRHPPSQAVLDRIPNWQEEYPG